MRNREKDRMRERERERNRLIYNRKVIWCIGAILISNVTKHRILNRGLVIRIACTLHIHHTAYTFPINSFLVHSHSRFSLHCLAFFNIAGAYTFSIFLSISLCSSTRRFNSNPVDLLLLAIVSTADSNDRNTNR